MIRDESSRQDQSSLSDPESQSMSCIQRMSALQFVMLELFATFCHHSVYISLSSSQLAKQMPRDLSRFPAPARPVSDSRLSYYPGREFGIDRDLMDWQMLRKQMIRRSLESLPLSGVA